MWNTLPEELKYSKNHLQSFLNRLKDRVLLLDITGKKKGILRLRYQALIKYDKGKPAFTSRDFINDLNLNVDEGIWARIWQSANTIAVCNRT